MPTYRYKCKHCEHTEDIFLKMSEFTLTRDCPKCDGKEGLEKIPNAGGGFQLKGDGYYVTDFRNK